jgi:hypothetical protein
VVLHPSPLRWPNPRLTYPGGWGGIVVPRPRPRVYLYRHGLGCGAYTVYVTEKGGGRPLLDLPFGRIAYNRPRSETGRCTLTTTGLTAHLAADCRRRLRDVEPWETELLVLRDGEEAWTGPIVFLRAPGWNPVELEARDVSEWPARRRLRQDHHHVDTDLATIFEAYTSDALAPDNPGVTLEVAGASQTATRDVKASEDKMWSSQISELGRTGVQWSARLRVLRIGGSDDDARRVGVLLDEHFAEPPDVTKDGLSQATVVVMRGAGGGETGGVRGEASSASRAGVLDLVVDEQTILDDASAVAAAQRRLSLVAAAPIIISDARLDSSSPIPFRDLWGGNVVRVVLNENAWPVDQQLVLSDVQAEADAAGGEKVTISLEPLRSASLE